MCVAPAGSWRDIGVRVPCARVAFGESLGIRRGAGPGGTRTDRGVFFGLLSRRRRGLRGPPLPQPAIIPMRHATARSVNTSLTTETLPTRAMPLFVVGVAAVDTGADVTGVGVICSGTASVTAGAPHSAQHAHNACSEMCRVSVHRKGVRMIHFPVQPGSVFPEFCETLRTERYCWTHVIPTFGMACPQHDARWRQVAQRTGMGVGGATHDGGSECGLFESLVTAERAARLGRTRSAIPAACAHRYR